jgi:hypothetical protein
MVKSLLLFYSSFILTQGALQGVLILIRRMPVTYNMNWLPTQQCDGSSGRHRSAGGGRVEVAITEKETNDDR